MSQSRETDDALEEIALETAATLQVIRLRREAVTRGQAREANEEELRVAQVIQRSLLPATLPAPPGWDIEAHYQPAHVVGGDLYDVIPLPNDLLGIVVGDVSDKSVPAALMMAAARTLLRATAQSIVLPGQVLSVVNDGLCSQIPPGVFVTCFFAILDPATGRFRFANAGHCAPVHCTATAASPLQARGWPLGMMPGTSYGEGELMIAPGESILCFSDGLIETHDAQGAMFGAAAVIAAAASAPHDTPLIEVILRDHSRFAGPRWEQEDDLTLFTITRTKTVEVIAERPDQTLTPVEKFFVPSEDGSERQVAERVVALTRDLVLTDRQRERLQTAVAESVMNAIEHGNRNRSDLTVSVEVLKSDQRVVVRVADQGRGAPIPEPATPNLEAKLAGLQSPRGWGLFLIKEMVDSLRILPTEAGNMIELTVMVGSGDDYRGDQPLSASSP